MYWKYNDKKINNIYLFVLLIALILGYARFIEPKILLHKNNTINLSKTHSKQIKIIIFADTHFGIFTNGISALQIVNRVNGLKPDLILIPGDFLNELKPSKIKDTLEPFKNFIAPVFAVTGNHDEQAPGPNYESKLVNALIENNIQVVNNSKIDFNDDIAIVGLSDLWGEHYNLDVLNKLEPNKINILLAHNPDMVFELSPDLPISLIVSGHTHGGQIRIPWLYKKVIPTNYDFDFGFYENKNSYKVFVTPGTGMVGLPFRFLMPPRLDILYLKY